MKIHKQTSLAAPLLLLAVAACDDHDEMHDRDSNEACSIMQDGPSLSIVAAEPATAAPPSVSADHKRYDIRLPVGEPMNGLGSGDGSGAGSGVGSGVGERGFDGVVSLPIAEAGEYALSFDADAQVAVTAADGTPVALGAMVMPVSDCPDDIFHSLTYTLPVGTYTVRIGSSSLENIRLVIDAPAGDGDHHR